MGGGHLECNENNRDRDPFIRLSEFSSASNHEADSGKAKEDLEGK